MFLAITVATILLPCAVLASCPEQCEAYRLECQHNCNHRACEHFSGADFTQCNAQCNHNKCYNGFVLCSSRCPTVDYRCPRCDCSRVDHGHACGSEEQCLRTSDLLACTHTHSDRAGKGEFRCQCYTETMYVERREKEEKQQREISDRLRLVKHWMTNAKCVEYRGKCVYPGLLHPRCVRNVKTHTGEALDSFETFHQTGNNHFVGGSGGTPAERWLDDDECYIAVRWWSRDSVNKIQLLTNKGYVHGPHGKIGVWGTESDQHDHQSNAAPGECLIAIEGRDHRPLFLAFIKTVKRMEPKFGGLTLPPIVSGPSGGEVGFMRFGPVYVFHANNPAFLSGTQKNQAGLFKVVDPQSDGSVALQLPDLAGKYLCMHPDGKTSVAPHIKDWERFYFVSRNGDKGPFALVSREFRLALYGLEVVGVPHIQGGEWFEWEPRSHKRAIAVGDIALAVQFRCGKMVDRACTHQRGGGYNCRGGDHGRLQTFTPDTYSGECITKIEWYEGHQLDKARVCTNRGRCSDWCGTNGGGYRYREAPAGNCLSEFTGLGVHTNKWGHIVDRGFGGNFIPWPSRRDSSLHDEL